MRSYNRAALDLRPISIQKGVLKHAEGSALIEMGDTRVLCAASIEDGTPLFLRGSGKGWVTAEYGMLPRSTKTRTSREAVKGKQGGRTMEIQRMIGRSLRSITRMDCFGEMTVKIDCDVLQADGGTRVASVTGGYVALVEAFKTLVRQNKISVPPVMDSIAAVSVGIVDGRVLLDLDYSEDSCADVDMNVVMTGNGGLVEIQGTGEDRPFPRERLNELIDAAWGGISQIIDVQKKVLESADK